MLNKHAITNLVLVLIAGALLAAVAQGGLAQLSPLFTAAPVGQTTATTDGPPNSKTEVVNVPPLLERLLVYAFLIWALALGVEAGVEFIRWVLHARLSKEPGPTEILNALNPWLPSPVSNLEKPEPKDGGTSGVSQAQDEQSPKIPVEAKKNNPLSGNDSAAVKEQVKALRGIALHMNSQNAEKEIIKNIEDWTGIFRVFALEQQQYLENRDRHLRLNRAISLFVAIVFAFATGINSFTVLIGSDTANGNLWYQLGGILLSAFAATAGSAVWHDLLDKLRQSKEPEAAPEKAGSQ